MPLHLHLHLPLHQDGEQHLSRSGSEGSQMPPANWSYLGTGRKLMRAQWGTTVQMPFALGFANALRQYSSVQQPAAAYSGVQQRTPACSSLQQRTAACSNLQQRTAACRSLKQRAAASGSQQPTACSSLQQPTAAYGLRRLQQPTSCVVRRRQASSGRPPPSAAVKQHVSRSGSEGSQTPPASWSYLGTSRRGGWQ